MTNETWRTMSLLHHTPSMRCSRHVFLLCSLRLPQRATGSTPDVFTLLMAEMALSRTQDEPSKNLQKSLPLIICSVSSLPQMCVLLFLAAPLHGPFGTSSGALKPSMSACCFAWQHFCSVGRGSVIMVPGTEVPRVLMLSKNNTDGASLERRACEMTCASQAV